MAKTLCLHPLSSSTLHTARVCVCACLRACVRACVCVCVCVTKKGCHLCLQCGVLGGGTRLGNHRCVRVSLWGSIIDYDNYYYHSVIARLLNHRCVRVCLWGSCTKFEKKRPLYAALLALPPDSPVWVVWVGVEGGKGRGCVSGEE